MNDWTPSQTCPGYREKTIQRGVATIVIRRPILSEGEQARREQHVQDVLGNVLRDYIRKKEI
jgi:hypothetical protein